MSGHGFHVHGPHDHEVEHVAQHGGDNFTSRLAVLTAILSTVGAIFGYMGGHSQNAALLYKNEAAIQKTAASNQWNYYQAKSNKQNLAELSITLTTGADGTYTALDLPAGTWRVSFYDASGAHARLAAIGPADPDRALR